MRDAPDRALFGFGAGIGDTTFSPGAPSVPKTVAAGAALSIHVTETNVGARRGDALVRADVHKRIASRTRPVRQMKAFTRVALDAGTSARVTLTIAGGGLALVAADGAWRIDPGAFDLWVMAGPDATLHTIFADTPPLSPAVSGTP